ncbi:zinc finger CCCH domain-containing protein 17 isoform X2 [Durio zibethinus]|uniref:Zinc finger CCCH domain-containing protein 17 isoform X2 n=1 Tax=Durio zibethinus TaxID=66656 RepID=A0A6P6BHF4_DURZI|nr:zinc finger CCCH domain-containing protein 17 isoform X2 [Durio zibethinus]
MVAATQHHHHQQQQPQQQKQAAMAVLGATKTSAEEEALKRNTDCVYFLASPLTCKKGSECEYRHSEYARINPRDCYYWLNGNCLNPKCGFRHPPLDGLLGTQVAAPAGSSMSSLNAAATPTPASHTPYNQGASYSSNKQAVPCIFFQKGLCLKGDRCAFLHGPTTSNKAPQPAATTTTTEPHSLKKAFGAPETSQLQKFPSTNVSKTVGVAPEGLDEELPRHKGTNTTSVVNGGYVGRSNCLLQAHALDEPSFHGGRDTDEFLRESSPGFDVLVDDELRDSDFYHGEDHYGGTRGHEARNVNEYDISQSTNHDAISDVDPEMFHDARGYDSFDHVKGNYGWDQQRASSERISLGSSTLERWGYSRAESLNHVEESDLRHRLSKHRRVNGLRSVVNHDHALENHEGERNFRGSLRDSYHLPPHDSSLSNRLRGRIKLPGKSLVNGTDLRSEREIERGRNLGWLSPGKPQISSHHGGLRDRIKGRVEGEFNNKEGRNFGGLRIRREIMGERNADFAGPKSLAELKVEKNTDNKEYHSLGKRKSIEDYQQTEGDLSFEGPMPLSVILKRKRQSEVAASGSGIASVNKDVNQKQSKGSLISSSTNTVVSVTPEEANRKEESKSTTADIGTTEVTHGESSQLHSTSERETQDGTIADERMEDHELEADDQRDGDYYYDQGDEGEYNYEEGENVDPEEEYIEEEDGEDGDDFAKKLGVMFS